ncbi:PREDICTED: GATA zinc finger domain-containing protein 10-like [Rhagoletis zephyria]|uniref:GATA zinc finger domain-containing protein 10-like n=1 Tax=Rhagoletis zephyria TaxID=28612 RepID=UPI000811AA33|nr:PREDICTED: GATA zinc finger domain-containing protein 10-like [Rhagoletis zephyria]
MNEAQIKQLVEAAASQAQQQQQQQQQQQSSSGKSSSQNIDPLHVTSYNSMIKLAELHANSSSASSISHAANNSYNDIIKLPKSATTNVHQQQQQQLFEALNTNDGASFDSQSVAHHQLQSYILQNNHHHQQQQQHQQQHQQHHNSTNNTSTSAHQNQQQQQQHSHQSTSMVSTNSLDINLLMQENQKLSNIARVCIHLIDRCRNQNKSKHFISDLQKLSSMINSYNGSATSYLSGTLPVLDNIGALSFKQQQNGGHNNVAPAAAAAATSAVPAISAGVNYSAASLLGVSSASNDLLSRNANTLWLQLNGATPDQQQHQQQQQQGNQHNSHFGNDQTTFIQHQVNTDNGPIQILKPVQVQSESNSAKLSNTPGAIKQRKRAQNSKLRLNQLRMQMVNSAVGSAVDATQQSILFKKLTQAEQLSAAINNGGGGGGGGGQGTSGGALASQVPAQLMMDFAGIHENIDPSTGQTIFSLVHSNLNGGNSSSGSNGDGNNSDMREGKAKGTSACESA